MSANSRPAPRSGDPLSEAVSLRPKKATTLQLHDRVGTMGDRMASGRIRQVDKTPRRWRVGMDIAFVGDVAESIARFGDRYVCRIFTPHEISCCVGSRAATAEGLAARFAAKEATIKVLRPTERALGDFGKLGAKIQKVITFFKVNKSGRISGNISIRRRSEEHTSELQSLRH